jgi:hypothetical protein
MTPNGLTILNRPPSRNPRPRLRRGVGPQPPRLRQLPYRRPRLCPRLSAVLDLIPAVILCLAGWCLTATPAAADDVTITARLDPSAVTVGEQATLQITLQGKFRKSAEPELPSLPDVDVYDAGTQQSFNFINGAVSASVTFTYTLIPRKEGTFEIAPIRLNLQGKVYTANSVTLEVAAGRTGIAAPAPRSRAGQAAGRPAESVQEKSIFIQADVDRDTVYVNQQVTWTLGYYTDGRVRLVRSPNYTPPEAEGFWAEELPPVSERREVRDGRPYQVNEIRRGYFPTAPGRFTIGSSQVELVIDDFGSTSIDDFFNRPMRSFGFGTPKTLATRPIEITVLPLPAAGRPRGFKGLVGRDLDLQTRLDKQVTQVGEPVTLSLQITGIGNVKTMAAPVLPEIDGFKLYESGSSENVFKDNYIVSGRKTFEYVLVPKVEGAKVIPPVQLSYFDPVAHRYVTAASSALRLDVQPGVQEEGQRIVFAGGEDQIEVLARDIKYIHPVPAVLAVNPAHLYSKRVFAALQSAPLLAVLLSLLVERRRRRWRDNTRLARYERASREALKKLSQAEKLEKRGDRGGAFSKVAEALREYLADKMNAAPAGLTFDAIDEFLAGSRVGETERMELKRLLDACDAAKYSAGSSLDGRGADTMVEAGRLIKSLEKGGLGR